MSDQGCGLKRLARRWRCPAEFGAHPKSLTSLNAQLIESNLQENVEQGLTMAGEFNRAAEAFLDRGFALYRLRRSLRFHRQRLAGRRAL